MHGSIPASGAEPPGQQAQLDREADQALLRAVVQVALELAARGVGRLDDPRARLLELDARVDVGDRLPDQLGERVQALLGVGGERLIGAPGRDRAPQLALDVDRRAHAGPHPELADLLRVRAFEVGVGVGAGRTAGALDLLHHGAGIELDRGGHLERLQPGRGPVAEHGRGARAVEAGGHRRVGLEVPRDLARDEVQHVLGRGVAGDQRRHAPQRLDLVQARLQRALQALVLRLQVGRRHVLSPRACASSERSHTPGADRARSRS